MIFHNLKNTTPRRVTNWCPLLCRNEANTAAARPRKNLSFTVRRFRPVIKKRYEPNDARKTMKNLTCYSPSSMMFNDFWQIRIKGARSKTQQYWVNSPWPREMLWFQPKQVKLEVVEIPGNTKAYKAMGILISIHWKKPITKISIPSEVQLKTLDCNTRCMSFMVLICIHLLLGSVQPQSLPVDYLLGTKGIPVPTMCRHQDINLVLVRYGCASKKHTGP